MANSAVSTQAGLSSGDLNVMQMVMVMLVQVLVMIIIIMIYSGQMSFVANTR